MSMHEDDVFRVVLPAAAKAEFLEAIAAAAAADGRPSPAAEEEQVPQDAARAFRFDPASIGAMGLVCLKFAATAVAGHVICRAFDRAVLEPFRKKAPIVVVDARGRRYEVTAQNIELLRRVLAEPES